MQQEIDLLGWPLQVRIFGVNAAGSESGNAAACEGKDIPWLQETAVSPVWSLWDVVWRDVVILDTDNVPVATYNLTEQSLDDPTHYAELLDLIGAAAGAR